MDEIGHADGMVRFIDDKTVLINNYSDRDIELKLNIKTALHNANLNWIEIPYNPYNNGRSKMRANGIYINYLQMEDIIIVPTFNMKEDEAVVRILEDTFTSYKIKTVESNDIARKGGVLNCITWNIKK
jgi:agmatine deiminase